MNVTKEAKQDQQWAALPVTHGKNDPMSLPVPVLTKDYYARRKIIGTRPPDKKEESPRAGEGDPGPR